MATLWYSAAVGDTLDIVPDIGEGIRFEGHDFRAISDRLAERALDILEGDGADFALRLGEDVGGLEGIHQIAENFVDRPFGGERFADAGVDFLASPVDVEAGAGNDGQACDRGGEVALVGTADLEVAEAQGMDDLGGTGDHRDDS